MKFYSDWALRIAHGQWTDHQAFYGLPGYAYCLALIFRLVGGFDPFVVGLLQALFDAGIAVLIWKISSRGIFRSFAVRSEKLDTSPRTPDFIGIGAALAWIFSTPGASVFHLSSCPPCWLVFAYYFRSVVAVKNAATPRGGSPWLGLGAFLRGRRHAGGHDFLRRAAAAHRRHLPQSWRAGGRDWLRACRRIAAAIAVLVAGRTSALRPRGSSQLLHRPRARHAAPRTAASTLDRQQPHCHWLPQDAPRHSGHPGGPIKRLHHPRQGRPRRAINSPARRSRNTGRRRLTPTFLPIFPHG